MGRKNHSTNSLSYGKSRKVSEKIASSSNVSSSDRTMGYSYYLEWLYSLESRPWHFNLDRISALLKKLGDPHKKLKVIHVAGTNGKGSTCAMLAETLIRAGYKIGLYTSPHIVDFRERIRINGEMISVSDVLQELRLLKRLYRDESFFELTTALAFDYFSKKNIDILVCEVGLGGRRDATNVVDPLVSIITTIDLEHTKILGSTVKKIAGEKAGIIKPHRPVITIKNGNAFRVISQVAKKRSAKVFAVRKSDIAKIKDYDLALHGVHQGENAALVVKTCSVLRSQGFQISDPHLKSGLANAYWPGRLQFLKSNVLIDAAHNPQGCRFLAAELRQLKKRFRHITVVMGVLDDKDAKTMIHSLDSVVDVYYFTRPNSHRAENPTVLAKLTKKPCKVFATPTIALAHAIKNKEGLLVICGSIYLLGDAFKFYGISV
jgi:dihydrofolate synthase / folylpolyglutamate synthase